MRSNGKGAIYTRAMEWIQINAIEKRQEIQYTRHILRKLIEIYKTNPRHVYVIA